MPILDTTTCMMACLAALGDSPNLFPFSSVTGIPYLSSLNDTESLIRRRKRTRTSSRFQRNESVPVSHLCLMKGMLMQLAAATAANGTNRLTIGGRRCGKWESIGRHGRTCFKFGEFVQLSRMTYWSQRFESQCGDHGSSCCADVGGTKLTAESWTPLLATTISQFGSRNFLLPCWMNLIFGMLKKKCIFFFSFILRSI